MTKYVISFDAHAMDHIPEHDMPAVAEAAHAVCQEAISAGQPAHIFPYQTEQRLHQGV